MGVQRGEFSGSTLGLTLYPGPKDWDFLGLYWWSSGLDSVLQMQGAGFDPWPGN